MGDQHAHDFLEQLIALGARLGFEALVNETAEFLVVLVQVLQDSFRHTQHFLQHRCPSLHCLHGCRHQHNTGLEAAVSGFAEFYRARRLPDFSAQPRQNGWVSNSSRRCSRNFGSRSISRRSCQSSIRPPASAMALLGPSSDASAARISCPTRTSLRWPSSSCRRFNRAVSGATTTGGEREAVAPAVSPSIFIVILSRVRVSSS